MVWPSPNWSVKDSALPYSTTTPTSEDVTGAIDHSLWSEIGETFIVKSNITNWFECSPDGGNLVTLTEGNLNCSIVKHMVDDVNLCGSVVVPYFLKMEPYGQQFLPMNFIFSLSPETKHVGLWQILVEGQKKIILKT